MWPPQGALDPEFFRKGPMIGGRVAQRRHGCPVQKDVGWGTRESTNLQRGDRVDPIVLNPTPSSLFENEIMYVPGMLDAAHKLQHMS